MKLLRDNGCTFQFYILPDTNKHKHIKWELLAYMNYMDYMVKKVAAVHYVVFERSV